MRRAVTVPVVSLTPNAPRSINAVDSHIAHFDARVCCEFLPCDSAELWGWHPITGDEVLNVRRLRISWRSEIAEENTLARSTQSEGGSKTGWPTTDDDDVVTRWLSCLKVHTRTIAGKVAI